MNKAYFLLAMALLMGVTSHNAWSMDSEQNEETNKIRRKIVELQERRKEELYEYAEFSKLMVLKKMEEHDQNIIQINKEIEKLKPLLKN